MAVRRTAARTAVAAGALLDDGGRGRSARHRLERPATWRQGGRGRRRTAVGAAASRVSYRRQRLAGVASSPLPGCGFLSTANLRYAPDFFWGLFVVVVDWLPHSLSRQQGGNN